MIETIHSPYVHDGTTENFKSIVLANSNAGPVLVNFWSRKAGPCLRQYPILDKIVHDYSGRLLLVNVDTESEFVFTKEFGIASVPTLKLFRFAKVVETLHGFQTEESLKKVLDLYVARKSDTILADAIQRYAQGNTSDAYKMIAEAIVEDPVNARLPAAMCKLLRHEQRYAEAIALIDSLPENIRKNSEIVQLNALLGFDVDANKTGDIDALLVHVNSSPDDMEARKQLIAVYVAQRQYENALQQVEKIIESNQKYDDNYAQKAMLRVFTLLGQDHPLVAQYRPILRRYAH